MIIEQKKEAQFHLPGLFEFYEFYQVFLPLFFEHREYFYEWVDIASIYGAPADCIWGGGRVSDGLAEPQDVLRFTQQYGISARLTFSNSLLRKEHLADKKCNRICELFENTQVVKNGIIVHSDLLLDYLKKEYPGFYFVSSTTKVLTDFALFHAELERPEFEYVVPDFRLNKQLEQLNALSDEEKDKVEFLCNECCDMGCRERKICYENVSRKILGEDCPDHVCHAPYGGQGYRFSRAMENPAFISLEEMQKVYLPAGFTNFKVEGRGLGSAMLLEFLIYYLVKPEFGIHVREAIYLDSMLDLF